MGCTINQCTDMYNGACIICELTYLQNISSFFTITGRWNHWNINLLWRIHYATGFWTKDTVCKYFVWKKCVLMGVEGWELCDNQRQMLKWCLWVLATHLLSCVICIYKLVCLTPVMWVCLWSFQSVNVRLCRSFTISSNGLLMLTCVVL